MKLVTLKLTTERTGVVNHSGMRISSFAREFIDPKMPGYKSNADEMSLGKTLIGRLRFMLDPVPVKRTTSPSN